MKLTVVLPRSICKQDEFRKNILHVSDQINLIDVVKDLLQERFSIIFNEDGISKGFALCFYNDDLLDSLHGKKINDGDELEIITAKSGG